MTVTKRSYKQVVRRTSKYLYADRGVLEVRLILSGSCFLCVCVCVMSKQFTFYWEIVKLMTRLLWTINWELQNLFETQPDGYISLIGVY